MDWNLIARVVFLVAAALYAVGCVHNLRIMRELSRRRDRLIGDQAIVRALIEDARRLGIARPSDEELH